MTMSTNAHGNEFTDAELGRIASSGGSITVTPSIEMSTALGTFRFLDVHLGIPVGIAAGPVASSGADQFFEMRIALAAERSRANAHSISQRIAVSDVQWSSRRSAGGDPGGWRGCAAHGTSLVGPEPVSTWAPAIPERTCHQRSTAPGIATRFDCRSRGPEPSRVHERMNSSAVGVSFRDTKD